MVLLLLPPSARREAPAFPLAIAGIAGIIRPQGICLPSPMKDATKTHINAGILLGGIALAAITAPGVGVAACVGGVLAFMCGLGGNQAAKWFGETLDASAPDHEDLFRNHHLRILIQNAAAVVVASVIAKKGASTGTLDSAKKHIGTALDKALSAPKSPLVALYDFNLPDILTEFAKKKGKVKLLTVGIWEQFLDTLPAKLWKDERTALAEALHDRFAAALWELVKADAKRDKQAFAAVELLYLSRILAATEGMSKRPEVAPILRHIEARIGELDEKHTQLLRRVLHGHADILTRLDTHAAVLARVERKLDTVLAAAPLQSYYRALREQFSTYENLGLPVAARDGHEGEQDQPIPIRQLFVAPACSDARMSPEAFDAALRAGAPPARPLLPLLAPPRQRTVLLADPGMGKSTLVQWLIATLAEEATLPADAAELRGAIPLPFILRDLVSLLPAEVGGWDWAALVDAFRRWHPHGAALPALAAPLTADEAFFRTLLGSERAFFLIDGLDEIGDPARRLAIRNALWEGFAKYPEARWLITSRIVGYELAEVHEQVLQVRDGMSAFHVLAELGQFAIPNQPVRYDPVTGLTRVRAERATLRYLAPFDDTQQHAFAQHWYRPRLGPAAGTRRAADFIAAVALHPHTRVIGRVPNLLYLLALLYRHKAHLPDGRALVYEAISHAYLSAIDIDRHLPHTPGAAWKPEEKEALLATIAMRMQEQRAALPKDRHEEAGEILVTRAQLEQWLGQRLGGEGELQRFLDHIAHRSGLLLPRGEGLFGFAHLSFQEYYAACALKSDFRRILNAKAQGTGSGIFRRAAPSPAAKDEERVFAERAALPAWHEPLLFLVEKLRDSAEDTATLFEWAFPQLVSTPVEGEPLMPLPAAQLLAALSLDQEVALDIEQRRLLWSILWKAHLAWQGSGKWHLAPALLGVGDYQPEVLRALIALKPKRLHLTGCTAVSDLTPLRGLAALKSLVLIGCTAVGDLTPLRGLSALESLVLGDCTAVCDITPLNGLFALQELHLNGCTAVSDLTPLVRLAALQDLSLYGCQGVSDLAPLHGLVALQTLVLTDCTAVSNLTPLCGLAALRSLWLTRCTAVSDLTPLSGLAALGMLIINDCTAVSDLTPLSGLSALQELYLARCTAVSEESVAALRAKLPKLSIHRR